MYFDFIEPLPFLEGLDVFDLEPRRFIAKLYGFVALGLHVHVQMYNHGTRVMYVRYYVW